MESDSLLTYWQHHTTTLSSDVPCPHRRPGELLLDVREQSPSIALWLHVPTPRVYCAVHGTVRHTVCYSFAPPDKSCALNEIQPKPSIARKRLIPKGDMGGLFSFTVPSQSVRR